MKWKEFTHNKFEEWNKINHRKEDIQEMYDSFLSVWDSCMEECVPKKTIKVTDRRRDPLWINDEVKEKKTELNRVKKVFKKRSTPSNLNRMREVETEYEEECEKAKDNWINDTCSRMEVITDPKEKWRQFKSLTSYRDEDVGGVLPLLNEDRPVFDANEKSQLLQDVFFGGKHMEGETLDEDFRKEVDSKVQKRHSREEKDEERDEFLDREICIEETEAAIQLLKKSKAPGMDNIYSDLLKSADNEVLEAVNTLFQKSWQERMLPQQWKTAKVKFLKKPGKPNYHNKLLQAHKLNKCFR